MLLMPMPPIPTQAMFNFELGARFGCRGLFVLTQGGDVGFGAFKHEHELIAGLIVPYGLMHCAPGRRGARGLHQRHPRHRQ